MLVLSFLTAAGCLAPKSSKLMMQEIHEIHMGSVSHFERLNNRPGSLHILSNGVQELGI